MSFEYTGSYMTPIGDTGLLETYENQFWWGKYDRLVEVPMLLSGAARDVGNTSYTHVLRPGLLLGRITSTKKLVEWSPTATDGSQQIFGVLQISQNVQRLGANQDRWMGFCIVGGNLKAARLLIPGETSLGISGNALEYLVRAQLSQNGRFLLDDELWGNAHGGWRTVLAKTADYTVLEADHDVLFTNRGDGDAINFTLPATARKGLRFGFYCVAAQTLTLTAGTADTLLTLGDATADTVALATTSKKIGGFYEVIGDGTGWLVIPHNWIAGTTIPAALTENTGAIGGTSDGDLPALVDPSGDAGASVIAGIREVATRCNTILALLQPTTLTT